MHLNIVTDQFTGEPKIDFERWRRPLAGAVAPAWIVCCLEDVDLRKGAGGMKYPEADIAWHRGAESGNVVVLSFAIFGWTDHNGAIREQDFWERN